jgi:ADP-ribose pyrophosphatase
VKARKAPDAPSLIEVTRSAREIYAGRIVRLELVEVELPGGRRTTREVIYHPGAAVILPLLDLGGQEQLLLVRQYRKAVEEAFWELPAGTLELGETPLVCAQRELIEETGYRATEWSELLSFYPSPGVLSERMTLFLARGLQSVPTGERAIPEDESLRVNSFTLAEAHELISNGGIKDAKTIIGVQLAERSLRERP